MLSLLLSFTQAKTVDNYAVIMCGSKGWSNYRHQADVYAWHHILTNRGFASDHIISLSYDDVAYRSGERGSDGSIYHTCNGPNLWKPIINYTLSDANKENFFKVLSTIPSSDGWLFKREVNVLIIYINHGAYDLLSTPNAFDQPIYADEFGEVVSALASRVSSVFCILEACYSGTMAMHARYPRNVMFMTAANAKQSSYSHGYCEVRCDPEGSACERLGIFTTNEMTYHVLNYLDDKGNDKRSLNDLILYAKHQTNLSTVIRSGMTNRIPLKAFFKTIGKKGINGSLGNTTVNVKARKRNVNSLTNEELLVIYNRIRRTLAANIDPVKQERTIEIHCRKRVSAAALQLFINDYLHEDNIEFLTLVGNLCEDYSFEDIHSVMSEVRNIGIHERYYGSVGRYQHRESYGESDRALARVSHMHQDRNRNRRGGNRFV